MTSTIPEDLQTLSNVLRRALELVVDLDAKVAARVAVEGMQQRLISELVAALKGIMRNHASRLCSCTSECGDCFLHVLIARAEATSVPPALLEPIPFGGLGLCRACGADTQADLCPSCRPQSPYFTADPPPGARDSRSGLCWGNGHAACVNPDCECPCGEHAASRVGELSAQRSALPVRAVRRSAVLRRGDGRVVVTAINEMTVTVDIAATLVIQMVCSGCTSRVAIIVPRGSAIRALRFCPVCASNATFFNAEDRQW